MKILRVTGVLYPYVMGGISLHVHDMSMDQVASGYEVDVYTSLPHTIELRETKSIKYHIVNFKRDVYILGNPISLKMFSALLTHANEYDIVHAHGYNFFSTLLCAIAKKIKKFRLVLTIHGIDYKKGTQTGPLWFTKIYACSFGRFVFSSSDLILTYTNKERDFLIDMGVDSEKIKVIHNGIHCEKFALPMPRNPKKQILWVGRYVTGKGIRYLIKGFAKFVMKNPTYSLLLVGDGPDKPEMTHLINTLGITNNVILQDFIPNDSLPIVYADSEIFVLSSLLEGVPRVMLEAMASGMPIISTDLPQLLDIVDGCGLIVPTKDSDAIANALEMMVSNPEFMYICGKNARTKIITSYDWHDTVQKTNEAFENLMKS